MSSKKQFTKCYEIKDIHEVFPKDWEKGMLIVMIEKYKNYYIPYESKYSPRAIPESNVLKNLDYFKKVNMDHYKYVYKTTNLLTGEFYMGKHTTPNIENSYLGRGSLLKKKISEYGEENFKKEILFFCKSDTDLSKKERQTIDKYKVTDEWFNMYNLNEPNECYYSLPRILII